jgi:hypothetical protein
MPQRDTRRGWVLALALLGAYCGGCDGPGLPTFTESAVHDDAAFLSVGGTSRDDVWVVGARPSPSAEPIVLRSRDGGPWQTVETGTRHDLWWVHAFEDGTVFLAGAGSTVLRVRDGVVERTPTPAFFGFTVYGVWGASPDDVWAVGGFAGRDGFAWRFDGTSWTSVPLPADLPRNGAGEPVGLFKVWGRSADDVWLVGGAGAILHWDGAELAVVPSGTRASLFTVTGDADHVYVVGGAGNGVVLRGGRDGFVDESPPFAPLLQGVVVDREGTVWAAGAQGYAARRRRGGSWEEVELGLSARPESIHALWSDDAGGVWAAGGGVLTPRLDRGVVSATRDIARWEPAPVEPPSTRCPDALVDPLPDRSIARRWNEQLLNSIRRDIPDPPKHARNIHHTAVAMWDAWAAWQDVSDGVVYTERHTAEDVARAREVSISHAAYRVLAHRYASAVGAETSLDCYRRFMDVLGLDPTDRRADGDDPVSVGNRIGQAVIDRFLDDGANERNGYADTSGWTRSNPVMLVDLAGTNVVDPDEWQPLNLGVAETQNGIVLDDSVQGYIGPHWRFVEPFAIEPDPVTGHYGDPVDGYPTVEDPRMVDWVVQMIRKSAELDSDDGVMWDIGPGGRGNNPLGTDDGAGYDLNPVTGEPYAPNLVPRGDFTRVVAEMWADGPQSETPPGHWNRLSNEVSDRLRPDQLIPFGEGSPVDRLAWDVGLYLTVSGATHDAAINAWELKRLSLGQRPITIVRWMADRGQRSDPSLPSYHDDGLPLVPGLIELITEESARPGERHHHLRFYVGEVAVWSWPGEPGDRAGEVTPIQWMRARDWIPYQRRTFVNPAFPGFTSGHSTFSRAAAEAMAAYTASPWFPGGLHGFTARRNEYLVFEEGPSVDVRLEWASYFDAADQAGQSRLWGGIHVWPDDWVGRVNGSRVGQTTSARARQYWDGTAR